MDCREEKRGIREGFLEEVRAELLGMERRRHGCWRVHVQGPTRVSTASPVVRIPHSLALVQPPLGELRSTKLHGMAKNFKK